ncbi:ORF1 [torque teno Delphinidae virus 31]
MPHYAYRRRRGPAYRSRYGYYNYRYQWRARRQRYWSWNRRRAYYRWVRGTRRGGFLFFKNRRRNRRNRLRFLRLRKRRRFLRWLTRYRYRLPKPLLHFNPPYIKNCTIKGYFPLLFFTGQQISWPFIDPVSHVTSGGGLAFHDFTLNKLFLEHEKLRNIWSASNYGYEAARFIRGSFTLYRHPYVSYMVKYFQGRAIHKHQTYMDIHPGFIYLHKRKKIMAANNRVPLRKQFTKKKIRFKRPKDTDNKWYPLHLMGSNILIRLGVTIADFLHPFETCFTNCGKYYYTIGYQTPDRRTVNHYQYTNYALNNKYSTQDINTRGKFWVTWGGPINIKYPYLEAVDWCSNKFPELLASGVSTNLKDIAQFLDCGPYKQAQTYKEQGKKDDDKLQLLKPDSTTLEITPRTISKTFIPAYFVTTTRGPQQTHGLEKKLMRDICGCTTQRHGDIALTVQEPYGQVIFEQLVAGLPFNDKFLDPQFSASAHRSRFLTEDPDNIPMVITTDESQAFWPGRYNANYDNGKGNLVYALYLIEGQRHSKYIPMATGTDVGPGIGKPETQFSYDTYFPDTPYWLLFYGHNYKTFLNYLNNISKDTDLQPKGDIKKRSIEQMGYFAVAIRCFAAEPVQSGAFEFGYAPLRYLGLNFEYFTSQREKPYPTFWHKDQNHPPVNFCGDVDREAWIFCLLRDGRSTMYGSSLEATLLNTLKGKDFFCTTAKHANYDDIAIIGRSGPFIMSPFDKRIQEVVNLFARYSFTFQWAGYSKPHRCNPIQDTTTPCTVLYNPNDIIGSTAQRRFRRSIMEDPHVPHHPVQVSYSHYHPPRDCSPGGTIDPLCMQRLTSEIPFSAAHLGLGSNGRPTDNALLHACSALPRESLLSPTSHKKAQKRGLDMWPGLYSSLSPEEKEVPPPSSPHTPRRKRCPDPQGGPDEVSDFRLRHPQPNRGILRRLGLLRDRRHLIKRQLEQQMMNFPLRHSRSLSDLCCSPEHSLNL